MKIKWKGWQIVSPQWRHMSVTDSLAVFVFWFYQIVRGGGGQEQTSKFYIAGTLLGETTGDCWIPITNRASNVKSLPVSCVENFIVK